MFEDLNGSLGFLRAIQLVLRVRLAGLCTLAIPCNSFEFMSSSQHGRSWSNPLGNNVFPFVVEGNMVCSRASLLIALGLARSIFYFVENPEQSTLPRWPYMCYLASLAPIIGSTRTFWWGLGKAVAAVSSGIEHQSASIKKSWLVQLYIYNSNCPHVR